MNIDAHGNVRIGITLHVHARAKMAPKKQGQGRRQYSFEGMKMSTRTVSISLIGSGGLGSWSTCKGQAVIHASYPPPSRQRCVHIYKLCTTDIVGTLSSGDRPAVDV